MLRKITVILIFLNMGLYPLFVQTSGKIAGFIAEDQSGEPFADVNIFPVGAAPGAASDMDGFYTILNVYRYCIFIKF